MTNNNAKAVRATIFLGEIPLEVFQFNDEYRLSQTQVAEAIEKDEILIRRFLKGESPEALPYKDFKIDILQREGKGNRIKGIPVQIAIAFWTKEAISGNVAAARLLGACATESIERRADEAFGVQRKESERQTLMKARISGKEVRRTLTDAITTYVKRHSGDLSDNAKKWMYNNVSEAVNLQVFGRRANKLCQEIKAHPTELRNALNAKELLLIQEVEDVAMRLIDAFDTHPIQAVKDAGQRLVVPVQTRNTPLI